MRIIRANKFNRCSIFPHLLFLNGREGALVRNAYYCANKCLSTDSLDKKCSDVQCLQCWWYKYFHHGRFQVTYTRLLNTYLGIMCRISSDHSIFTTQFSPQAFNSDCCPLQREYRTKWMLQFANIIQIFSPYIPSCSGSPG